jgi:hypothetical protein
MNLGCLMIVSSFKSENKSPLRNHPSGCQLSAMPLPFSTSSPRRHMIILASTPPTCFTPTMVAGELVSPAPPRCRALGSPLRTPTATAAADRAQRTGPDQRPSQSRQQSRNAYRPAILRPRLPVHPDHKPPRRKWRPKQQHLQIYISSVILDSNSQVCFHNYMQTAPLTKVNRARRRAQTLA